MNKKIDTLKTNLKPYRVLYLFYVKPYKLRHYKSAECFWGQISFFIAKLIKFGLKAFVRT